MSISAAPFAALVVSYTFNQVAADIDHALDGSASGSPRSRTETQGAKCAFVAPPETRKKDAESDMGILGGCAKNEQCVKDDTSSLGGRCAIVGAEDSVTKAHHRDLSSSGLRDTNSYTNDCIECTMSDGTPGKKCDGAYACKNADTKKVSCGSCNGMNACRIVVGPIGGNHHAMACMLVRLLLGP